MSSYLDMAYGELMREAVATGGSSGYAVLFCTILYYTILGPVATGGSSGEALM